MPPRYDGGETYYVDWEGNPTPLEGGRGPPTFGKGKLAKEGGVTQRLTLTPHYREEDIPCSAEEGRTTCTKGGGRPGSGKKECMWETKKTPRDQGNSSM